ncbi:hypothetical protein J7L01_03595, partial [bacterium]|nr:hypothetical protein [bacterium]
MKKMMVLVLGLAISLCLAQTHSLEIHASIDGEPGYCDSLLSLVGAVPGAGIHDIPDGDTINLTIDTTLIEVSTGARDSCYGWSATGSPCPTTDTCFGEGTLISFLMTEDTRFTWNFKRQFTFEVTCSHPGYDSPEPPYGVHWFDRGDTITASVDVMDSDYVCLGHNGTGSVDLAPDAIWTGVLEEPSLIEWMVYVIEPACSLLVISDHGICIPTAGLWNYFLRGSEITVVTSAVDSSDSLLGIIYNCIGWRGTGCVPAIGPTPYVPPYHICAITCTTSGTLEWLWDTVSTNIDEENMFPNSFSLSAHPNPFNSAVRISVGEGLRPSRIEIFDIAGRMVANLPSLSV